MNSKIERMFLRYVEQGDLIEALRKRHRVMLKDIMPCRHIAKRLYDRMEGAIAQISKEENANVQR